MARIIQAGEFATEGEREASEALSALPADWVVICNKTLVTTGGRSFEIDFIVLGDRYVFVLDEKSWTGRIHGSDQVWVRDDGSSERSPLTKVDYVAKVVAGALRAQVAGLRDRAEHFVHGAVLLSRAEEPPRIHDQRAGDGIVLMKDAAESLVRFDNKASHDSIRAFRPAIETYLVDLRDRPKFPKRINEYQIQEIRSDRPGKFSASALHDVAGPRSLTVYNVAGGAGGESKEFVLREFEAVRKLHDLGIAPLALDPFTWSDDYLVLPFEIPAGKALAALKAPDTGDELKAELSLAIRAFDALAEMHRQGIVHRAISPDNIYFQVSQREARPPVFAGFHAARVHGQSSIASRLDELVILDPYAAPELALSYGLAEQDSDVYSLALVFLERLTGLSPIELLGRGSPPPVERLLQARWGQLPSGAFEQMSALFSAALSPGRMGAADVSTARPEAKSCGDQLRLILRMFRTAEAEESGGLLDSRYRVRRRLGGGSSGLTYLVEDEEIDATLPRAFVVKVFHYPETVRSQAAREFALLRQAQSPYLPRVYDVYPPDHDVHLKMEYVPGPTLDAVSSEFPWDEEKWHYFALHLLSAIEALEHEGLRHRDLKPSNIILRPETGTPVLIDFSFAVPVNTVAAPAGSLRYLPPEAGSGDQPPESIDRYAAAVLLHEALTGVLPADLLPSKLSARAERAREVLLRAASSEVADRFPAAREFKQELENAWLKPDEDDLPGLKPQELVRQVNPWVDAIRGSYRSASTGNADNRGLDSDFARATYVPTALDLKLLPAILRERPPAVFLSGNPGDGKTAFLEQIRTALLQEGAKEIEVDASGWVMDLDGHTFRCCYDASESRGQLTADEQLKSRLAGLEGSAGPSNGVSVLVAVNDGRLVDFFRRYEGQFSWLADRVLLVRRDGPGRADWPWVVDLKARAVVTLDDSDGEPSVFQRLLSALIVEDQWSICLTCKAHSLCPIYSNAIALQGKNDKGRARHRLESLATLTHLRRDFHPTIRDLRSCLSLLITGNLSCEDVHAAAEGDGIGELLGPTKRFWFQVFDPPADADELVAGMSRFDPALEPRPRLDRFLATHARPEDADKIVVFFPPEDREAPNELAAARYLNSVAWQKSVKRRLYFFSGDIWVDESKTSAEQLLPYRFSERFLAALRGEENLDLLRSDVVRGISMSDGISAESLADSLCVRIQHNPSQQLTVMRRFPVEDFSLNVIRPSYGGLVEAIPEVLEFRYKAGSPLLIGLDLFELLLRFARGVRPTAPEYEALLEDLVPFKNNLILSSSAELVLLEAERRLHVVAQSEGRIVRRDGGL